MKEIKSKFLKIECLKCNNQQIIFGKATTPIKCLKCGKPISESGGGKAKIRAKVLEVLD